MSQNFIPLSQVNNYTERVEIDAYSFGMQPGMDIDQIGAHPKRLDRAANILGITHLTVSGIDDFTPPATSPVDTCEHGAKVSTKASMYGQSTTVMNDGDMYDTESHITVRNDRMPGVRHEHQRTDPVVQARGIDTAVRREMRSLAVSTTVGRSGLFGLYWDATLALNSLELAAGPVTGSRAMDLLTGTSATIVMLNTIQRHDKAKAKGREAQHSLGLNVKADRLALGVGYVSSRRFFDAIT